MGRKVFRNLVDQNTARTIFYEHLDFEKFQTEEVELHQALGRVLASDIFSSIDVPPFDRASMDGFVVIAKDTNGAGETSPVQLQLVGEVKAGYTFDGVLQPGQCVEISTGAPMPRGSNAVVMVEYSHREEDQVKLYRAVTPKENTMAAGTDIQLGERIVSGGRVLTSRELATIAAIGKERIEVIKRPRIGVFSSGDEIVPPGTELQPGKLFDINSTAIITSLLENGGDPYFLGIIEDVRTEIFEKLNEAKDKFDLLLISGGTSAGMGDMLYEVIDELGKPGLLVHGVKVKPGKPTILAVCDGTPIVGLPGYPASALSILQLFVIPLVRKKAGLPPAIATSTIKAKINQRFKSAEGRYEFKPVYLFRSKEEWIAYPVPGGSGAITSVALADGFVRIPENTHFLPSGTDIDVHLMSDHIIPPTIQIIGSYDFGLTMIQHEYEKRYPNEPIRMIGTGSSGGLSAVRRGETHLAGIHMFNETQGYNNWVIEGENLKIIPGYYRKQGLIVKNGNPKSIHGIADLVREDIIFLNQNIGSEIRNLLDYLLKTEGIDPEKIAGYQNSTSSHISAALAVEKGDVDVIFGLKHTADSHSLDFIELHKDEYDLLVSEEYVDDKSVRSFIDLFSSDEMKDFIDQLPGYTSKRN